MGFASFGGDGSTSGRRNRIAGSVRVMFECGTEGVPAKARAFYARRIFAYAGECGELAELGGR
jgi:hypothetical protein